MQVSSSLRPLPSAASSQAGSTAETSGSTRPAAHFRRGRREGPLGRLPLPAPRTVFLRGRCRAYLGCLLDLFQSPGPDIIDVTIGRIPLRNATPCLKARLPLINVIDVMKPENA